MRKFLPERPDDQQNLILVKQLRTNKPLAPYARRSDPTAKDARKDRTQSREMQTEDMIKWGKKNGWLESLIYPYFADLGLSGTLRPDQRPDMLRLFDDLDSGKLDGGTIACWQENRPFRDETHIYYNQLIDKMLQHDVVFVVLSPRLYIYDMRDPFDKERLREKFKEAAEFIPKHVKGWLHPARERAAWEDDEWAGMGNLPPGFIVDMDPKSEMYKHIIPYWPHIEKVREHFLLYRELGGEISLVYKHLREFPIIFPEFGPEVDRINVDRFKMSKYPGGGYYMKSKSSIRYLFTQSLYIGYRSVKGVIRRDEQGNKLRSFEPVIEQDLFDFAYYRNAMTDLDGNPIEGQQAARRFFQQDQDGDFGLLKFRIKSNQGEVQAHADNNRSEKGFYSINTIENSFLTHYDCHAAIAFEDLDSIIVRRLLEHVNELCQEQESIELHEEQAAILRNERLAKINQIENSISDIDKNQGGLTRNLGKVEAEIEEAEAEIKEAEKAQDNERREEAVAKKEIKERRKQLIEQEIEMLEIERKKIIRAKEKLEEETEEEIGTLEEELVKLKKGWSDYSFKKRRSLINFAIQEVVIDVMSTHWIKIEVLWLHQEWGREEMFYYRTHGKRKNWTDEERSIVKEHYATMPKFQLMALLPDRGWEAIQRQAFELDVSRPMGRAKKGTNEYVSTIESYSDLEFMRRENIPQNTGYTNWKRRCSRIR